MASPLERLPAQTIHLQTIFPSRALNLAMGASKPVVSEVAQKRLQLQNSLKGEGRPEILRVTVTLGKIKKAREEYEESVRILKAKYENSGGVNQNFETELSHITQAYKEKMTPLMRKWDETKLRNSPSDIKALEEALKFGEIREIIYKKESPVNQEFIKKFEEIESQIAYLNNKYPSEANSLSLNKVINVFNQLKEATKNNCPPELTERAISILEKNLSLINEKLNLKSDIQLDPQASSIESVPRKESLSTKENLSFEQKLFNSTAWNPTVEKDSSQQMKEFQQYFLHSYRDVMGEVLNVMNQELSNETKATFTPILTTPAKNSEILFAWLNHQFSKSSFLEKIEILNLASQWLKTPHLHNNESIDAKSKQPIQKQIDRLRDQAENTLAKEVQTSGNSLQTQLFRTVLNENFKVRAYNPEIGKTDPLPLTSGNTSLTASITAAIQSKDKAERNALAKAFANDLRALSASAFCKIRSNEFAHLAWSKEQTQSEAPNVLNFAKSFNLLTNFICSQILSQETPQARANAIKFFINVQTKLLTKKDKAVDFNSAMAIQAAFGNSAIARLYQSWKQVSAGKHAILRKRNQLFSNHLNFSMLKEKMKKHPNHIPFLGLSLSEVTFANEGNPAIRKDTNQINAERITFLGKTITAIDSTQEVLQETFKDTETRKQTFNLEELTLIGNNYNEDQAYKLSLAREPREGGRKPRGRTA